MIVLAAAVALAYAGGVRSLAARGHSWSARRSAFAAAGVIVLAASAFISDATFTGHMIEHIALGMAAPLLFALAAPITLALQTSPAWLRPSLRRGVHSRSAAFLGHPLVGLAVFATSLTVLYLTPLLQLSVENRLVHVGVHLHLLLAGALFVWPLVAVDPIRGRVPFGARILTVMAAIPFHAFLGVTIMSTSTPLAPNVYPSIDDQHRAGGLLWMSGEIMSFVLASIVVRAWLAADARAAARTESMERQLVDP